MTRLAQWIGRHPLLSLGIALPLAAFVVYVNFFLPWSLRWGAAQQDVDSVLPGDDLIPRARIASTRAILIHRPPRAIFPLLSQVGQDRGGFRIEAAQPDRYVLLRAPATGNPPVATRLFYLLPIDSESTRLIVRGRSAGGSHPLTAFLWSALTEPARFAAGRRTLLAIRDRAESAPPAPPSTAP